MGLVAQTWALSYERHTLLPQTMSLYQWPSGSVWDRGVVGISQAEEWQVQLLLWHHQVCMGQYGCTSIDICSSGSYSGVQVMIELKFMSVLYVRSTLYFSNVVTKSKEVVLRVRYYSTEAKQATFLLNCLLTHIALWAFLFLLGTCWHSFNWEEGLCMALSLEHHEASPDSHPSGLTV
jgi:hypothetical protein